MSWADTTGAADLLVVPRPRPCRRAGHVPGLMGAPYAELYDLEERGIRVS